MRAQVRYRLPVSSATVDETDGTVTVSVQHWRE